MKTGKKIRLSPLFFSLFIHGLALLFVVLFPPTKSLIFFKMQKHQKALTQELKEKILEEIQVVQIPKKVSENEISEWLHEEIGSVSEETEQMPHIDFAGDLHEQIAMNLDIDESSSWNLQNFEKIERSYENYLSPLYQPIPSEFLDEEEKPLAVIEPIAKPFIADEPKESPVSQIEDFDYSSFVKDMPEMLDTELFSFTDENQDNYFRMELRLKDHKLFEEKPEEFLFVIDMTQKDVKKNIESYQEAIVKSMSLLKPQDRFNIVLISKTLKYLFDKPQTLKSFKNDVPLVLQEANPKFDGKFPDFLKNLGKIFDKTEESDLHTHCILFTNEPESQTESLLKLSKFAHSKLSLYPVLLPQKTKHHSYVSLVEKMGGRLLELPTKASFHRKLSGLIMDIKRTKLSNVSVHVTSESGPLDVNLSEKTKQLTLRKPLKIFGKLDNSKTIRLQVIGSHGDDMYEMKKTMSIYEAKKGSPLIKVEATQENKP